MRAPFPWRSRTAQAAFALRRRITRLPAAAPKRSSIGGAGTGAGVPLLPDEEDDPELDEELEDEDELDEELLPDEEPDELPPGPLDDQPPDDDQPSLDEL